MSHINVFGTESWHYKIMLQVPIIAPPFVGDAPVGMLFEMVERLSGPFLFEARRTAMEDGGEIWAVEVGVHPDGVARTRLGWIVGHAFVEVVGASGPCQ